MEDEKPAPEDLAIENPPDGIAPPSEEELLKYLEDKNVSFD